MYVVIGSPLATGATHATSNEVLITFEMTTWLTSTASGFALGVRTPGSEGLPASLLLSIATSWIEYSVSGCTPFTMWLHVLWQLGKLTRWQSH